MNTIEKICGWINGAISHLLNFIGNCIVWILVIIIFFTPILGYQIMLNKHILKEHPETKAFLTGFQIIYNTSFMVGFFYWLTS